MLSRQPHLFIYPPNLAAVVHIRDRFRTWMIPICWSSPDIQELHMGTRKMLEAFPHCGGGRSYSYRTSRSSTYKIVHGVKLYPAKGNCTLVWLQRPISTQPDLASVFTLTFTVTHLPELRRSMQPLQPCGADGLGNPMIHDFKPSTVRLTGRPVNSSMEFRRPRSSPFTVMPFRVYRQALVMEYLQL